MQVLQLNEGTGIQGLEFVVRQNESFQFLEQPERSGLQRPYLVARQGQNFQVLQALKELPVNSGNFVPAEVQSHEPRQRREGRPAFARGSLLGDLTGYRVAGQV